MRAARSSDHMKEVPFYPNRHDGMSCMLAVYRSIIEYFTGKQLTWEELEELTGYTKGVAAWTIKPLTTLSAQGWDIKMIEPFDYAEYAKEGDAYLDRLLSAEEKKWYQSNSNLKEMIPFIPEFMKSIDQDIRNPTLVDIDTLLSEDRLVSVTVNSRILNNRPGFVSHMILVISKEGDEYVFHDPGSPAKAYRREKGDLIQRAMGKVSDATGFKL